MDEDDRSAAPRARYRWPWFVLAAVVLGLGAAIVWMSIAAAQLRSYREPYAGGADTNSEGRVPGQR
jgi:hypothetical protein